FSNAAYYNGNLDVSPNVSNSGSKRAIQRFKVENAQFIVGINTVEAEHIVQLVAEIFKKRMNDETIGIIVFNGKQKELVEDRLEAFAQKNASFQRVYLQELNRVKNGEDASLFIKNIENVQGDERDIIILGTTYGPNQNGAVLARFGTLTNQGGENRLNVAISRAKKKVYIVTSFEPEQLNVQNSQNAGPKLFRKYLEYVRAIDDQAFDQATAILDSVTENNTNSVRMYEQFANGENVKALIQRLEKKGYTVHEKVGTSKYGFDLAIYDEQIEQYLLGIELDETPYQVFTDTRERDVFNRRFLNSKGWKVLRIWSKDLANNITNVVKQIETAINN
ncbi:MAG: AAA domain-containing protein, partial [Culicoidibacterales bacterium]